jgi:hypothetical protein
MHPYFFNCPANPGIWKYIGKIQWLNLYRPEFLEITCAEENIKNPYL